MSIISVADFGDEFSRPLEADTSREQTAEGRRFYRIFLICLIVTSIPVKNLAYVVPPLYLFLEWIAGESSARRTILLMCIATVASGATVLVDAVAGQAVNVPGLLLALLTYLPLFIFFGARCDRRIGEATFKRLTSLTAWFVILQSAIGAVQFALSRNGDAVSGSFGLLDFYLNSISISQVYFTFTLFGMILFLLIDPRRALVKTAIAAGLFACAVAQSGHQTVFFVFALAMVVAIQLNRVKTVLQALVLGLGVMLLVFQFYPETWTLTRQWWQKVAENPRSGKRLVVADSVQFLARPKNAILGLGMGQYTSRASLITSNEYLNRKLPDVITGKSDYYEEAIAPALVEFAESGEGSAISKPYFSALSVLTEFGLIGAAACGIAFLVHLKRNLAWLRSTAPTLARLGMVSAVGLLFFLLCCGIENYIEFPQAIFLPLLLYIAAQSRAWQLGTSVTRLS